MEGLKKICGFITILTSIACFIVAIVVLFTEVRYSDEFVLTFAAILISTSIFYFSFSTKFWNTKPKPIKDLDNELEIIKKNIEKKELLNKLKLLEEK